VVIGNPPWLAFRHMTDGLQKRFRELATVALHGELAAVAREAEALAATFEIPEATPFARARRTVRDGLRAAGVSDRIDALVARLLDA